MNTFLAYVTSESPRIARLVADGTRTLANRLGRNVTDVESLNVTRKARIVSALENVANTKDVKTTDERLSGSITCALGCVECATKISNRAAYQLPSDSFVQIVPKGVWYHSGKDLHQVIDDKSIAAMSENFKANNKEVLLDSEHHSQDPALNGTALAWITEVQPRDDGLYGKLRLTEAGDREILGGNLRYVSPVFKKSDLEPVPELGDKHFRVLALDSAGAVNVPNMIGRPLTT
jgi:hypothetical protein